LKEIRRRKCPRPRSALGVAQLDSLVDGIRPPPQQPTNVPLAGESPTGPSWNATDPVDETFGHDDVGVSGFQARQTRAATTIEVTSPKPTAGKTSLLYHLTALAVLPKQYGGQESVTVFVDNDGRFSAARLQQMMKHIVKGTAPSDPNVVGITTAALNHVHVFRPQSSSQLLSILDSLPSFLLDRRQHPSIHRPVGLIAVDSATAFYWPDRFDHDMAKLGGQPPPSSKTAAVVGRLKALQSRFECAVVFTTASGPSSSPSTKPDNDTPVVSPWTSYAALTLSLSRSIVPQFAPPTSLDECRRDADRRLEAVAKPKFVAVATTTRIPTDQNGIRESTNAAGDRAGQRSGVVFTFRITASGVDIE
jgi:hypothetical protein